MSYTRSFSKQITVHYSGSTSYPASEHGGTTHYSGSTTETIYFDVTVDTEPFDDSVEDMKHGVDLLTGSVVATEAAQVATVRDCSRRVGNTIISGFFKTVRSDISQQIAELKIKSEALLLQLNELSKRCRDKQRAMNVDYQRISSRYGDIFGELNKELENRIYSLDEPVFTFVRKTEEIESSNQSQVAVPTVTAGENARLHSKITAALAKKQAMETIGKARDFLHAQYSTDHFLNSCLMNGGLNATISAPFCYMESVSQPGVTDLNVYRSRPLENVAENRLVTRGSDLLEKDTIDTDSKEHIERYFKGELAAMLDSGNTNHAQRVAIMAEKLFQNFITKSQNS